MPRFVTQRTLYEARERPSKMYSWLAFVLAQIAAEIPYQMVLGILTFAGYYYTVFGIQSSERQGLILLFCIENFVFASTFGQMVVAALPDAEAAGSLATLSTYYLGHNIDLRQTPTMSDAISDHHESDFQRSHAASIITAKILDIHVSSLALYM